MPPKPPVPPVPEEKDEVVSVPKALLEKITQQLADAETAAVERDGKIAGLEQMINDNVAAVPMGEAKIREKKSFEPKFRTVRLRKFPIAGGPEMGIISGWTSKGAYQEVDRSGVSPQMVDYIDVVFLGKERSADGKLQAEKVRLLDLLNRSEQIVCKIIKREETPRKVPTGEEINVSVFDPNHGMTLTGDIVDGYVAFSDIKFTVQVPGFDTPQEIDGEYVNR